MRTIRPIRDQILVLQDKPKEKLGSLYVPQGSRDTYEDFGTVVAIGPGTVTEGGTHIPVSVNIGDRVLFRRRPGSALDGEWKDHLMLKDEDIMGVVE